MRTAMILAAGLGTRLRPLTDTMPKAMVPYQGVPMIESLLYRLRDAGFRRIVINLHHFGSMLRDFVLSLDLEGTELLFSDESELLLDTGGAVRHASDMLIQDEPILIHNVDIISNIDLEEFYVHGMKAISEQGTGALLATNSRTSSRYLLFDEHGKLQAWIRPNRDQYRATGGRETKTNINTTPLTRSGVAISGSDNMNVHNRKELLMPHFESLSQTNIPDTWVRQAFGGIHLLNPKVLPLMSTYPEVFSIIDFYLNIATSHPIISYSPEGLTLQDIGKLTQVM